MDPMTALSLASAIVQFVDYSTKLVDAAGDIHQSVSGATLENQNVEFVVSEVQALSLRLDPPRTGQPTDDELALSRLAAECRILSDQILALLEKIKAKDPKSKRQSVWSAIKTMWNDREKKELSRRLKNCRSQLELQLSFLMGSDTKARLEALAKDAEGGAARLELLQEHVSELRQGVTVTSISPEFQSLLQDLLETASEATKREQILRALAFSDMYGRFENVEPAHLETFEWIFNETYNDHVEDAKPHDDVEDTKPEDHIEDTGPVDQSNDREGSPDGGPEAEVSCPEAEDGYQDVEDDDQDVEDGGSEAEVGSLVAEDGYQDVEDDDQDAKDDDQDAEDTEDNSKPTSNFLDSGDAEPDLDSKTLLGDVEHDSSVREPFLHWLSFGNGIFHISGKLGSGKSTLMKFLCEHERTIAELQKWAGQRKLVFAQFFFWKPGSELQRSLGGLFRCLLHDALQHCPELIPNVFPDQWNKVSTLSTRAVADLHLRNNEIREAFRRLIEYRDLYEKHCFCFFIDGLDEYEETRQEDYKTMVDLLYEWTDAAPNDVKICVSSREYNVFLNSLSANKRIRLQDLTERDMRRYIGNKLGRPDNKIAPDLIDLILIKSSGIFLWVALVVKSLRERLEETQDLSVLKEEIDTLPDELEDLFRYLLNSVGKPARTTAYKTFAMLEALDSYPMDLSLFAYSFLEDCAKCPDFATRTPFQYASMTRNARKRRMDRARKTLNSSTKGLVEVVKGAIKHIHRSIPEFLNNREVQGEMACLLQNFEGVDAVSQLLVAELRASMSSTFNRSNYARVISSIIEMRARSKVDYAPYSFLESLGSALIEDGGPDVTPYPVKAVNQRGIISTSPHSDCIFNIYYQGSMVSETEDCFVISPFYISAKLGLEEYVAWKVRHDQSILNTNFEAAVLVSIMESRLFHDNDKTTKSTQVLESLLKRGLSPQAVIHTNVSESCVLADIGRTVWENFVLLLALHLESGDNLLREQPVGRALEIFLDYGADPCLWLSTIPEIISSTPDGRVNEAYYLEMKVGRAGVKINAEYRYRLVTGVHPLLARVGGASFRELVEYSSFGNKESLLRLIDRNIKQQDELTEEERASEEGRAREAEFTKELMETRPWQLNIWFTSIKASHVVTFGLGLFIATVAPRVWATIVKYRLNRR